MVIVLLFKQEEVVQTKFANNLLILFNSSNTIRYTYLS